MPALEQLSEQLRGMYPFGRTFAISARHGNGVPQLREFLLAQCASGPPEHVLLSCWSGKPVGQQHAVHTRLQQEEFVPRRSSPGAWVMRADACTDMAPNELASEVLREKVFRRLYKELPYELSLQDVSFKTLADGSLRIEKNILVPTDQVWL